jgi:hypothetical protein
MRLPLKGSDYLCANINPASEKVQHAYLEAVTPSIGMQSVNAMLGDGTITQTTTFDPNKVRMFYKGLAKRLDDKGWSVSEISSSETEDLHRIFFQVSKDLGKYFLTGYFGVQFHAIPYYKVDKRVIEIQKELSTIADEAGVVFGKMSGAADSAVKLELEKSSLPRCSMTKSLLRSLTKKLRPSSRIFPGSKRSARKRQIYSQSSMIC